MTGGTGSIPVQGTKIPHAAQPKIIIIIIKLQLVLQGNNGLGFSQTLAWGGRVPPPVPFTRPVSQQVGRS